MTSSARRRSTYETVHPATIGHLRMLRASGVDIDIDGRRVFVEGSEVVLAPKEFQLLHALLENAGRALTRRQLLDAVWGVDYEDQQDARGAHPPASPQA